MCNAFSIIGREGGSVIIDISFRLTALLVVIGLCSCKEELKVERSDWESEEKEGLEATDVPNLPSSLESKFDTSKIDMVLNKRMSRLEVKEAIGEPTIDGISLFIYEFWDPLDHPLRKGVCGFIIHFKDGVASEVSWSEIG